MNDDELFDTDDDLTLITLTDEDGNEEDYTVISTLELDGMKYFLVVEGTDDDEDEIEAVILKLCESETDENVYEIVEDDAEFQKIVGLFKKENDDYDFQL